MLTNFASVLPKYSILIFMNILKCATVGSGHGSRDIKVVKLQVPAILTNGQNNISILSGMVGLPVRRLQLNQNPVYYFLVTYKIEAS